MNPRHTVDVVMAPATDHEPVQDVELQPEPEHADVAPDPNRRLILVAPTKIRGEHEARALGITPLVIVTPRTPDAARGYTADDIVWSDDLTAEEKQNLTPHVAPALVARP